MKQRAVPHNRKIVNQMRSHLVAPFALVAMLALSSCVSSDDGGGSADDESGNPSSNAAAPSSPGSQPDTPVIASSVTSSTKAGGDLRIDVHSLKRQNDNTIVLDFSMSNDTGSENIIALKSPRDGEGTGDFQPFSLIDGANKKKHLPLLHSNGKCYCSD